MAPLMQVLSPLKRFLTSGSILLTDSAILKLKDVLNLQKNEYLRLNISTSGCAGLSYKFSVDDYTDPNEDDDVTSKDGISVHITKKMLPYVKGSTIDFVSEPFRQYFTLRDNPNSSGSCSCGESFEIPGLDIEIKPCK